MVLPFLGVKWIRFFQNHTIIITLNIEIHILIQE